MWENINLWLNTYGGLISLIGLVISIVIVILTGNIKKNIKNTLGHDKYVKQRKKVKSSLQGICNSINEDNIYDTKLLQEISCQISILEKYFIFLDKKTKNSIKDIEIIMNNNVDNSNKGKMSILLGQIIGTLEVDESVYIP